MADRYIIDFDQETNRLKKKSYLGILQMLATEMGYILDDDIDLGGESNMGNELRFKAKLLDEFAQFADNMLNASNSATAQGDLLDLLLMNSSGLARNVDRYAVANITFSIPIMVNLDLNDNVELIDINGTAWTTSSLETIEPNINDPIDHAERTIYNADFLCGKYGDYTVFSSTEFVSVRINGQLATSDITICPNRPPFLISAGTVKESDDQYRGRVTDALSQGAKTLAQSLKNELLRTLGQYVKSVLVINSVGEDPYDADVLLDDGNVVVENISIPIHDLFIVVQPHNSVNLKVPNTSTQIAKILQDQITPGIRTFVKTGSPLANEDSYVEIELDAGVGGDSGYKEYLRFKIASVYNPKIKISLKAVGFNPSNNEIKNELNKTIVQKIINLSNGYLVNQDIDLLEIRETIKDTLIPVTYRLDENVTNGAVYITTDSGTFMMDGDKVNYGHWKATADKITIVWS